MAPFHGNGAIVCVVIRGVSFAGMFESFTMAGEDPRLYAAPFIHIKTAISEKKDPFIWILKPETVLEFENHTSCQGFIVRPPCQVIGVADQTLKVKFDVDGMIFFSSKREHVKRIDNLINGTHDPLD
jgi:hypothetical protein